MTEIRFHGRGGQGAVVASQILAVALFKEGKFVQSFPAFGVERRGAPVTAFIRIDDEPILLRSEIYHPNHVVVLAPTLITVVEVTAGLERGGSVLINTDRKPQEVQLSSNFRIATVDADRIAVKHGLGSATNPIVNTAILGAFARISGLVQLESLVGAVREAVPLKKEENAAATEEAYEEVQPLERQTTDETR